MTPEIITSVSIGLAMLGYFEMRSRNQRKDICKEVEGMIEKALNKLKDEKIVELQRDNDRLRSGIQDMK